MSSNNILPHILSIIKSLPHLPGVYCFYNKENELIYVGKAKNLFKRVNSYFTNKNQSHRITLMISKIFKIETTKVNTEEDALILENSLIKNRSPKYNILLRDDKTYPWILIKKERFPRVFHARQIQNENAEVFGPYPSVSTMFVLLDLIKKIFPIRNCNYTLSEQNIMNQKFKSCLEYSIGNCKAPCINLQTQADYDKNIFKIKSIIKGDLQIVLQDLANDMQLCADQLKFEEAQEIKKKIELLNKYQYKSVIVHPSITNTEVYATLSDEQVFYVTFFKINNGIIIQAQTLEYKKKLEETDGDMLVFAINDIRIRFNTRSKEIIVPFEPTFQFDNTKYIVPKQGDKMRLLDLCFKNLNAFKTEREKQLALLNPDKHTEQLLLQIQKDLKMNSLPKRIECFDNSNIQGAYAVSAMPVFIDGKPVKKEYRHFNVKTVEGPDDFATMKEVVFRRYSRVIEEQLPLPNLIVIDGGKGQLSAAMDSLIKLNLHNQITVIGIAKKLEEIFFPDDAIPLYLDKRSPTLKIIQHIRDEAHRFGITHHRNKRSKETFKSELNLINGISEKTIIKLLSNFQSIDRIKAASLNNLTDLIGKAKAKIVFEYYN